MTPLLLFFTLFLFPLVVIAQPPGGLTFESCLSDLGCTKPRSCRDSSTFRLCDTPSTDSACICVPPTFTPCTNSSQCIQGEVCARTLDTPFVCTSALVAVPPNGPTTAEEAEERAFIPNCPRPKSSKRNRPTTIPPPDTPPGFPPDIPPDAIPDGPVLPPDADPAIPPPDADPAIPPPDADPATPPLPPIPVPAPPGGSPPDVSHPKRNGLNLQICKPGTCARGLSCVSFDDAASFGPPQEGGRKGGQSFRCCDDLDPICICHARDSRASCLSNGDCNKGEVCAKTPVSPPTCTALEALEKLTPGQQRRVSIFEGSTPGKRGKRVALVEPPAPSEDEDEITSSPTEEEEGEEDVVMATPMAGEAIGARVSPVASASASPSADVVVVTSEASPDVEGQEEIEEDGVCIDAEALRHLNRSDVVFSEDRYARVVCDVNGSCATGGHMVRYRKKVMMMKRYCEMVGCSEKVMKVNSPRYGRGMEVESKTEGLRYTSLAARYGTIVEEGVLIGIIHIGL